MYVDSYNKTADEYNNGKIDKFNKRYIKKGKTFDDPNYEKEYMNAFEKDRMKHFMNEFEVLSYAKKCMLIGRAARLMDEDYSLTKIACELDISFELAHDLMEIVLVARNPEKYA